MEQIAEITTNDQELYTMGSYLSRTHTECFPQTAKQKQEPQVAENTSI